MSKRSIANTALAILVLLAGFAVAMRWPGARHLDWLGAALLCLAALPLAVRERWPVAVLAVNVLASTPFHANDFSHLAIAPTTMIALFTVAAQGSRRRTVLFGTAVLVVAGIGIFVVSHRDRTSPLAALSVIGWILLALVAGEALRLHRAYLAEAVDRAERAERLRIAHDLHDMIAHTITVIQVQAGVAAHLITEGRADPVRLTGALRAITAACDDARGELAATVGALSQRDPLPGLDHLRALAEPAEAAGISVEFVRHGPERTLPPAVQLVAYRIVQEALTNITKHSHARHATVALTYRPERLDLSITDDGAGNGAATPGFGLRGMAQRAAAIGGTADAGAVRGGFRVTATLPAEPT